MTIKKLLLGLLLCLVASGCSHRIAGIVIAVDRYDITYGGGDGAVYRTNFSLSGLPDLGKLMKVGGRFEVLYSQNPMMAWQQFRKLSIVARADRQD